MSNEKRNCSKCGKPLYCDDHHILPFKIFGDGLTAPLCKTCHDEFHRFLGFKFLRKKNAQPKEFYLQKWVAWISIIAVIVGITYFFTNIHLHLW